MITFKITGNSFTGITKAIPVAPNPYRELFRWIKKRGTNGVYYANVDAFAVLGDDSVMAVPYIDGEGNWRGVCIEHTVLEENPETGETYPQTYVDPPIIFIK